ncbi:MAG: tetratricopeptide repeat protein, partial [Actinobacteria bacterium]|nr:tetratricopeptide repeat protein [Actinomycetota bacterium]
LVFDNAGDPEMLRPFLPATGPAHVLITSEQAAMADLGTAVPVEVFPAGQARAFLAGRTGLADDEAAAEVAAGLGYLPLALAQAAAVITGLHLEYRTYLERLRALPAAEYLPAEPVPPYPAGAAEAVLLSLETAGSSDQSGVSARVTEMVAVLSEAGVTRPLLHLAGQAGALASGGRRLSAAQVDQALEVLAGWSLLTPGLDGQTVIMHPLVSRVVRDRLARRGRLPAVARAAASVLEARARALAGSGDRPAVRDITGQATALLGNVPAPEVGQHEELTGVLLRLRFLTLYHLIELGDSAPQAIAVGEPLTADLERILGPDDPDTMNARNSLAAAYQAAGQTEPAVRLFEQTLVGRERVLGPDHPDTLTSQNNLAAAYQDAGQTGEAILLFKMTLAAKERILGPDHLSTLTSRGNLAAAYRDAGRTGDAIPLLEQTLASRERILGPDHPDTISSRNNLAAAYRDAGRPGDAIPLLEQTLAGHERLLGPDDTRTLSSLSKVAAVYREAGRAAAAVPLARRVLTARERLLGADHPSTVAAMHNLAFAYRDAGQITEAIPLLELTLAACAQMLGEEHPRTRAARNDLAAAYRVAGRAV